MPLRDFVSLAPSFRLKSVSPLDWQRSSLFAGGMFGLGRLSYSALPFNSQASATTSNEAGPALHSRQM